jgi:hypothetical protein
MLLPFYVFVILYFVLFKLGNKSDICPNTVAALVTHGAPPGPVDPAAIACIISCKICCNTNPCDNSNVIKHKNNEVVAHKCLGHTYIKEETKIILCYIKIEAQAQHLLVVSLDNKLGWPIWSGPS